MIRWLTAGESHGPQLTGILEGIPAGLKLTTAEIATELERRRKGYGRGARQQLETDKVTITGGVRHGITTGAPISITIQNAEWDRWSTVMAADPVDPAALLINAGQSDERELARNKPLTRPRPGHADYAGALKYGQSDIRNVLERASARETAMRVALGKIAKALLYQAAGIEIISHVTEIGGQTHPQNPPQLPPLTDQAAIEASPLRTADPEFAKQLQARIDEAKANQNTVGGKIQVGAYNVPIGLGTHTQWDRRLDSRLAAAMLSIPSAKSLEIGSEQVAANGSEAHDVFTSPTQRATNHAGGLEGGMTNGQPVHMTVGFKPISTVPQALPSFNLETGEPDTAIHQRSDTCAVVPAAVIAESMLALVLAEALIEMFGGATLEDLRNNLNAYQQRQQSRIGKD